MFPLLVYNREEATDTSNNDDQGPYLLRNNYFWEGCSVHPLIRLLPFGVVVAEVAGLEDYPYRDNLSYAAVKVLVLALSA